MHYVKTQCIFLSIKEVRWHMDTKRLDGIRALAVLSKHRDRIWRVGTVPFLRYLRYYPDQSIHSPRSRASIVSDLMIFQARKEFDVPGIKVIDLPHPHTRTLFIVDNKILLRLKMMDESGRTRNVPTKFIKDFELDRELPGIPPRPHRMTLGYVLDPMQTRVSQVIVASHIKGKLEFYMSFDLPQGKLVSIDEAESVTSEGKAPSKQIAIRLIYQRKIDYTPGS